ncbi:MAG: hypothetical protein NTZ05_18475 [Chloroflexi bacterium]|nr:hypothetical protein [Chloroflexota bacterium]
MEARRQEPYEEDRITGRRGMEREATAGAERRMGVEQDDQRYGERRMGMAFEEPRLAERRAAVERGEPRAIERPMGAAATVEEYGMVRWGPIWAGTVAAIGVFGLLMSFGANFAGPAGALGSPLFGGMAIWAVISLVAALLAGGYLAGRFSPVSGVLPGLMHGFLSWSLVVALTVGASALLGLGASALIAFIPPNPATGAPGAIIAGGGPVGSAWAPFIGMVLGLIAALVGGYLGGRQVNGRAVYHG